MAMTIAFANQKGGVGKTTSVHNVGAALANKGRKTLLVDLDGQASLTISAGLEPFEIEKTIVSAMSKDSLPMSECVLEVKDNLHIVTSRLELSKLEYELIGRTLREMILKRALESVKDGYDYVLIDCPPQLSILTVNALACADYVIIPVKTDYLSYRGIELLMDSIANAQELTNPQLKVMGVIATLYEKRVKDDNEVLEVLTADGHNVLAVIKKLAVVKKGVYTGNAVTDISPDNEVAEEYGKVADHILSV